MKIEQPPEENLGLPKGTIVPKELQIPEMRSKRYSPEEAQLEANMMRIKLKEILSGNLKREPTSTDYDKALKMVEEMKIEALQDSSEHEKFLRRDQILEQYLDIGAEAIVRLLSLGLVKKEIHLGGAVDALDDATTQLERLKAEAEKLER